MPQLTWWSSASNTIMMSLVPTFPLPAPLLACPICRSDAALSIVTREARIHQCEGCHHVFTDPHSVSPEVYSADYYDHYHAQWNAHPDVRLYDAVLAALARHTHGMSILDVGCSRMAFLEHVRVKGRGHRLHGIDLEPQTPPHPDISYIASSIEGYVTTQRYDIITAFMVIEHVPDPLLFLTCLRELLNPRGIIVINTINSNALLYRTARLLHRVGIPLGTDRLYGKHHLQHFTPASLAHTLTTGGFAVLDTIATNISLSQVDHGPMHPIMHGMTMAGIWGCFVAGSMTQMTFAQTMIARKVGV
jgi:2-polyprenyl-3-methyl-5-hydroxy-6-metoxy-1,4-benzoquinol methylase